MRSKGVFVPIGPMLPALGAQALKFLLSMLDSGRYNRGVGHISIGEETS